MNNSSDDQPSISKAKQVDAVCDRFELAWLGGERLSIERLLAENPESIRSLLARELAVLELQLRRKAGESASVEEYRSYLGDSSLSGQQDQIGLTVPASTPGANPRRFLRYFGDFELIETIASGGMGTVFRARQLSLDRIVAVKMINRGRFASELEVRRFYSEAKAAASLDHPNIVPVYEVGEFENDHFYSMAFVDGQSLADRLKLGPMESRQAAELMQVVALAVQYAHERGVIHRDLKPSNILLDLNSRPRVADFGLAKQLGIDSDITASGEILGTPSFMAPEQAAGQVSTVGFASDIYALGAVLYTCVSGRPPFQAASQVATLKQVIEDEPVPLRQLNSAIPRDLETIAHKCLDKTRSRRYGSSKELAEDLERFLEGKTILARPVNFLEKSLRWCRRNPSRAINIASAIVFVLAIFAGWLYLQAREREVSLQEQAASLVQQLNVADESELPALVRQVRQQSRASGLLAQQFTTSPIGSTERYRAALALLPGDEVVLQEVCSAWLSSNWTEWIYIRDQLTPHNQAVSQWIQDLEAATPDFEDGRLARFAAIKATVLGSNSDNNDSGNSNNSNSNGSNSNRRDTALSLSNNDWERITAAVMHELLSDPSQLPHAAQALASIRSELEPQLVARTDYTRKELVPEASVAASLLAEFFLNEVDSLFRVGAVSKNQWMPLLFSKTHENNDFHGRLKELVISPIDQENWNKKIRDCRTRALAAGLLFSIGDTETVWPLLYQREDTTVRSLIIEWIPTLQRDPRALIRKARSLLEDRPRQIERVTNKTDTNSIPNRWLFDNDSSLLRAVLKTIGNYPARVIQRSVDEAFWNSLAERYEFDPDPGVHSTCEWLLRASGREATVNEVRARLLPTPIDRGSWKVVSNDHVMAVLQGPIEYEAGSDLLDPFRDAGESTDPMDGTRDQWSEDHRHTKQIARNFMIATHETRLIQLHACDSTFHKVHNKSLGPSQQHPACRVSWQLAATYCNWLSEREGISEDQWCFTKSTDGAMGLAPNYLQRHGYRLPSEAEWEYACRAGTTTRTYLGDSEELLPNNVWFMENSHERLLLVPGSFKCNGLGIFDALGNVQEWCMDGFDNRFPGSRFRKADIETALDLDLTKTRILRGGSIYTKTYDLRASEYGNFPAAYREGNTGFRIARTISE